jgi:hypothetical protein
MYHQIVYGKIRFLNTFDKDAKSLIKKLTNKEVINRFGSSATGINEIKEHRFFKNIDWELQLKCEPNVVPEGLINSLNREKAFED